MILDNKMTLCHGVDETLSTKLLHSDSQLKILTSVIVNT